MAPKPRSQAKTISAMKARQNFGQMLEEVYYKGEQYIIERAGKPMAAIIPLSQLGAIKHSDSTKIGHDPGKANTRRSKKRRS